LVSFEEIHAAYYMVAATGVLVAAVFYVYNMSYNEVKRMRGHEWEEIITPELKT